MTDHSASAELADPRSASAGTYPVGAHTAGAHPGAHPGGLRVAVIGAGPAGFYTALAILEDASLGAQVDMFDRLPAPYGLVRYGVAPDHQKIKSVTKVFERGAQAAGGRYRFFGNVQLGSDVTLGELRARYHAVVLSFGAQSDRHLEIFGEGLPGVYAAREFVAWYNGHPDFIRARFDLSAEHAVVVGIGNVAIDVARMLAHTPEELLATDTSDEALALLTESRVRDITILARRGPLQAACTPVELRELTQMAGADLVVPEDELVLDPISQAQLDAGEVDQQARRNYEILKNSALREARPGRKVIRLRFYASPVEILGRQRVTGMRLRKNEIIQDSKGRQQTVPLESSEEIPCGVVFRSIGYKVSHVPGVPYDFKRSLIPHTLGQVLSVDDGLPVPGLFVAGWAKRGPTGVIGTNKPDAGETARSLIDAYRADQLPEPCDGDIEVLLAERHTPYVSFIDWQLLDKLEINAGMVQGRPRRKMTDVPAMLKAIETAESGETTQAAESADSVDHAQSPDVN